MFLFLSNSGLDVNKIKVFVFQFSVFCCFQNFEGFSSRLVVLVL
jgi:hypothetical protein